MSARCRRRIIQSQVTEKGPESSYDTFELWTSRHLPGMAFVAPAKGDGAQRGGDHHESSRGVQPGVS